MKRLLLYLLPVLLLNGLAGWSFWQGQQDEQLDEQLAYSVTVARAANATAARQAADAIERLKATEAKNRYQPADLGYLRAAEALHDQVNRVRPLLREVDSLVRQAAGSATNATGMRQPAQPVFTQPFESITQRWRALGRQLTACADSLHRASPVAALPVSLPAAASATTAVQALADLVQAEHQLLASEAAVVRQLAKLVGARTFLTAPVALATAESNVVTPGDTYRAELLLATHFPADLRMRMTCDGHPVSVDSTGMGQVRFRAPLRSGPAAWTGTICLNWTGRDTTFRVHVPYRVARR